MKITNLTKLIIRFLGGGKIDFPTSNLREVEIEPFDGEGGSEESGNNDELISNTKKMFANFVNNHLKEDPPLYTEDDVELPDKYIYINNTDKEIYEVSPRAGSMAMPLYLKNRDLNENKIIITGSSPELSVDERRINIDIIFSDFTNKSSLNLSDYIFYMKAPN